MNDAVVQHDFDTAEKFIERSRHYLSDDFLPRLARALEHLSDVDVWWRPNEASNSVGNLLLHLAGNLRQWIVSGVGGEADVRRREDEFARRGGLHEWELLEIVREAVADADRVLAGLDPATLGRMVTIQGSAVTLLDAIYHAVEHFSMHTGQVLFVAKLRSARDLGLWNVDPDGSAHPTW